MLGLISLQGGIRVPCMYPATAATAFLCPPLEASIGPQWRRGR